MSRWPLPLVLLIVLAGCGKKSDPLPPVRDRPAPVVDLVAWQDGPLTVLRATFPDRTVAGRGIGALDGIEIWRAEGSRGEAADRLRLIGAPIAQLSGAGLREVTRGRTLVWSEVLAERRIAPSQPRSRLVYGIVVVAEGERSELSNPAELTPWPLLFAPEIREVKLLEREVQLVVLPRSSGGSTPRESLLYRQRLGEGQPLDPIGRLIDPEILYVDRGLPEGCYVYRAAAGLDGPEARGPRGGELLVEVVDAYPPPVPSAPEPFREETRTRLLWGSVRASDFEAYVVERRAGSCDSSEPWQAVGRPTDPHFVDEDVRLEESFCYRLRSVDRGGNLSDPSELVEVSGF